MTTPMSRVGRYAGSRLAETGLALATIPAATLVVARRRRARRRASSQAWRYRTHHEASADSQRIVSSNYQDDLSAQADSARQGEEGAGPTRISSAREPLCSPHPAEQ